MIRTKHRPPGAGHASLLAAGSSEPPRWHARYAGSAGTGELPGPRRLGCRTHATAAVGGQAVFHERVRLVPGCSALISGDAHAPHLQGVESRQAGRHRAEPPVADQESRQAPGPEQVALQRARGRGAAHAARRLQEGKARAGVEPSSGGVCGELRCQGEARRRKGWPSDGGKWVGQSWVRCEPQSLSGTTHLSADPRLFHALGYRRQDVVVVCGPALALHGQVGRHGPRPRKQRHACRGVVAGVSRATPTLEIGGVLSVLNCRSNIGLACITWPIMGWERPRLYHTMALRATSRHAFSPHLQRRQQSRPGERPNPRGSPSERA